jgi:outer membrane cobalamin receptor
MPLLASENGDRADIYTLGEVVVTGRSEGAQPAETVYTVTSHDIENRDARTLDQAISLLPGVNVRVGADGTPRIDIRGFRTRHVVLLLDGIPMNSALDQQFDPRDIPTENIAEIKLSVGTSSVLYGQGALGGVINIITKKGNDGVKVMASGETGSGEPYLARGTASGAAGRFDYFLSGSTTKVNGFPLSDGFTATSEQGSGYRKNSDRQRNNVLGTLGFAPNADLSLGLTVNYADGSYGKPSSVINDPNDPFASPPKFDRVDGFWNVSVQLAAEYVASQHLDIRGWGFLNRRDEHDNQYDNGNLDSFFTSGSFREEVSTSIKGVTLQPRYDLGKPGQITLSLSAEHDDWTNGGFTAISNNAFGPLDADHSLSIYSASVEYDVTLPAGVGLTAGYGHYWQTRSQDSDNDFSALAGLTYDLAKETTLKASFKRSVRFPSLGDLYDLSQGNSNLQTETSLTYQGGVAQKLPMKSEMELTGFYTTAHNLIQNDQATGHNTNLSDVRFAGLELAAATHYLDRLLLRMSYSYLHSEDRSRAGRDEQQYTPGNKLALESKYDFACGFTPYASLLYVGDQYFYTKNNITAVQKARLNDYALVNVKLSQRLLDGKVTLYTGVNNLLDENYETSYGFPQAGRFIYGGVEFRL